MTNVNRTLSYHGLQHPRISVKFYILISEYKTNKHFILTILHEDIGIHKLVPVGLFHAMSVSSFIDLSHIAGTHTCNFRLYRSAIYST
jgi:hypothetical protein